MQSDMQVFRNDMMFEDCGNCIATEQSGYINEWQNLLLTPHHDMN